MSINNFEHRQGSGYLSGVPLSRDEVWVIIRRLNKTYPWIKRFAKDIILTNVEGQFDIKQQLKIEEKARQKFRSKR
jgi:cell filamentation protein